MNSNLWCLFYIKNNYGRFLIVKSNLKLKFEQSTEFENEYKELNFLFKWRFQSTFLLKAIIKKGITQNSQALCQLSHKKCVVQNEC